MTYPVDKIVDRFTLSTITEKARTAGKKLIFTCGCFDIVHSAHVDLLQEAKDLGDVLIVGISCDAEMTRQKGDERPVFWEEERAKVLAAIECVDYVVIYREVTPVELLKEIKPNICVKGIDYKGSEDVLPETKVMRELGGELKLLGRNAKTKTKDLFQHRLQLRRKQIFDIEKWKTEANRLRQIKTEERTWLILALVTGGSVASLTLTTIISEGVSIQHRFIFMLGALAIVHGFAWIWMNKTLSLRTQYFSARANQIRISKNLQDPIPDSWQQDEPLCFKTWRKEATLPHNKKREIYTLVFMIIVTSVIIWTQLHPSFMKPKKVVDKFQMIIHTLINEDLNTTKEDADTLKWRWLFKLSGLGAIIALGTWPLLIYYPMDIYHLIKIWNREIKKTISNNH